MPRERVTLASMADMIAAEVGTDKQIVFEVMKSVCKNIGLALHRRAHISLFHLGDFQVKEDEHGMPSVTFIPTFAMTRHVRVRPEMNKYSVVLDRNKSVTAKLTGKCPTCGTGLESRDPPKCPRCGVEPFETIPTEDTDAESPEEA